MPLIKSVGFQYRGAVTGLIGSVAGIAGLWVSHGHWPMAIDLTDVATSAAGWLCFVAGVLMRLWATLFVGGNKNHFVVDQGPYSICRNPLYLGSFMMLVGLAVLLRNPFFSVGTMMVVCFYCLWTIPAEETFLRDKLGPPYLIYCQTVPRLIPNFQLLRSPNRIHADIPSLVREIKRVSLWTSTACLFAFLHTCR